MRSFSHLENIYQKFQAGFRKEYAATDHAFVLRVFYERQMRKKGKLYALFLDFGKAFDLISREQLWEILEEAEVPARIIRTLQLLYHNCTVVLQTEEGTMKEIKTINGVKQGDPSSPALLSFTVQKLEEGLVKLKSGVFYGGSLGHIHSLTYADDVLIQQKHQKHYKS